MTDAVLENRVTRLEDMMAELVEVSTRSQYRLERLERLVEQTQRQVDQTSRQLQEFKGEMQEFKEENRREHARMRREWGDLANKMGTMAEDLVAPSIPRILRTAVGCSDENIEMAVRVRRNHPQDPTRRREVDVLAACGEYVLVNETKSNLTAEKIRDFADSMPSAREFFPEYRDRQFIGAIAALYVDDSLVHYGERSGIIILGTGEDLMEVLNQPGFVPKLF